jgi:hypothetical protein
MDALLVARLLGWDAVFLAQNGNLDKAARSCQAMLGVSRTLGKGPTLMGALVRVAVDVVTRTTLQRILAQGELGEPLLAGLQQQLEKEIAIPLHLTPFRFERAVFDEKLRAAEAKEIPLTDLMPLSPSSTGFGNWMQLKWRLLYLLQGGSINLSRAAFVRFSTRWMEISKLPVRERIRRLPELAAEQQKLPWLLQQSGSAIYIRYQQDMDRDTTALRLAVVALAAERYRLAHRQWPSSLQDLVPTYLAEMPEDPYADGPFRLRTLPDRLVVYSLGPDGVDHGDKKTSANIHFLLWNADRRRQAAPPMKARPQ